LVFLESIKLQMCAPISQALLANSCMAFPIHRVSFFHGKMTNQVKLNYFDNSKVFFFSESLNTWGASVIVGTIVESINPSSLALYMTCNQWQ
jgi:hypothetical protein